MNLREKLTEQLKLNPDHIAIQHKRDNEWCGITYHDFEHNLTSLSSFLSDEGIKKDDKIAIILENRPEWPLVFFSTIFIGAVAVPIGSEYTQKEIIKTVYHDELKKFASYSFHDMNNPWEMLMADSLAACSSCFQTNIAREKNIPSIIFDPLLPPMDKGYKKRVNKKKAFLDAVKETIDLKLKMSELGDIIMQLTRPGQIPGAYTGSI